MNILDKLYLKKSSIELFGLYGFSISYNDGFNIWDNKHADKMVTNYYKRNGVYYVISNNDYYMLEFFIKNNNAHNIKVYKKDMNNEYKLIKKTLDNDKKRY